MAPTKQKVKCWTCKRELRKDKLLENIKSSVWVIEEKSNDELPSSKEDVNYISALVKEAKSTQIISGTK